MPRIERSVSYYNSNTWFGQAPLHAGRPNVTGTTLIRELTLSDLPRYKALRLEALRSDPDAFGETFEDASRLPDEGWSRRLSDGFSSGTVIFVSVEGSAFVGMCGVGEDRNQKGHAYVWGMFVSRSHRKAGLGARLLRTAEEWAAERGFRGVNAVVSAQNEEAVRFYRNLGYTVGEPNGLLRPDSHIPVRPISKCFG